MTVMFIREGFPGQRLRVVPRPLVATALGRAATSRLVVTDCGYFPRARRHGRTRKDGTGQTIVILCAEGRGWCRLGSVTHTVDSGHALVIPAGTAHSYGADDRRPWTIWWLHVAGSDVGELLAAARITAARPVVGVRDMYKATALVDEAIARLERDDSVPGMVAAAGASWHLLALLAADQTSSRTEDPIEQAQDFLQANVGHRVPISQLASIAGLSESHFCALFRQRTGCGVLEYQTRLRMARARELLDVTDQQISTIAHHVGYPDAFYFSRQFRRVHGMSPSDYRDHAKG